MLYEEMLDEYTMQMAAAHIQAADCLIVGGTSLSVYPAAGFVEQYMGDRLIVINKSPTQADKNAALVINDGIAAVFESLGV